MKTIRYSIFITLFTVFFVQCKKTKTYDGKITAVAIQTHLTNETNYITGAFALSNNAIVVGVADLDRHHERLYLFNSNLLLIDSLIIKDHTEISNVVLEDDGSFSFLCFNSINYNLIAFNVSKELKILKQRQINALRYWVADGNPYPYDLTKLADGTYIIANNNEKPGSGNKIAVVGVEDIFTSTKRSWYYVHNAWNYDWLNRVIPSGDSTFYLTGFQNTYPAVDNFVQKHSSNGAALYRKSFPPNGSNGDLFIENDRIIFQDFYNFFTFKPDGTDIGYEPIQNNNGRPSSNLISKNNAFFYAVDIKNADGNFVELRKITSDLKTVKSRLIGNQGSNNVSNPYFARRYLIKLPNGQMVSVSLIENPMLSGNQWLLQKFDEDLN